MPVISADFFFLGGTLESPAYTLGEEEEEMAAAGVGAPEADAVAVPVKPMRKRPILVLWERRSCALCSIMLPDKRSTTRYSVENIVWCVDRHWGFAGQRIVLKGNGEPALQALLEAIAKEHAGEAVVEATPRDGHGQANGAAEQGVRLTLGYARTLLAALADGLGIGDLPVSHPVVPWAVRHAAWL